MNKIEEFFKNKQSKIIIIMIFTVILLIILFLVFFKKEDDKESEVDEYYEKFYPEEVTKVFANIINVSCDGDMKFNIKIDTGAKKVSELSKNNLLDYMFSYLDKSGQLTDEIDESTIKNTEEKLFDTKVNLLNEIKDYNYAGYIYNLNNGKITRVVHECEVSDKKNILHLYGYSYEKNNLYVDINYGYLKDDILYDYNDKELGEYDGDVSKLSQLTGESAYYRITYLRDDEDYKLVSVEFKNRS